MNFKFTNNMENNSMMLEVSISPRKTLKEERKRIKFKHILELIKQNYTPPKTYTMGECVSNTHVIVDNDDKNALEGKWIFSLVPKKVVTKTKTAPAKKTKKTTTAKV